MTQKTTPSPNRAAEAKITGKTIGEGGGSDGWVVPSGTDLLATIAGLSGAPLNAFAETHQGDSLDVTIDTGEGFAGGFWGGRDVTTTVTLSSSTNNQTVYFGVDISATDVVIIGKSGDFNSEDPKISLWDFDTDSNGVTSATDLRDTQRTISGSTFTGDIDANGNSVKNASQYRLDVQSSDPSFGDGEATVWQSDGSSTGSDGDILLGANDSGGGGDKTSTLFDYSAGGIPNSALVNSSLTVTAGDGLKNGGSVSLGGSTTVDIEPTDFAGTGLEDDGSDNLRIASSAAGNALTGGSGSALAVTTDGIQTDELDLSISPTWTSQHQFSSGLDSRGDIVDNTTVIWDTSAGEIPDSAMGSIDNSTLTNSSISLTGGNAIDSIGSISLGGSGTIAVSSNSIQGNELDLSISPTWTSNHEFASIDVTQGGFLRMGDSSDDHIRFEHNAPNDNLSVVPVIGGVLQDSLILFSEGTSAAEFPNASSTSGTTLVATGSNNELALSSSTREVKENIQNLSYDPYSVFELQPKEFDFIDTGVHDFGYIAEEVEEISPELVNYLDGDPQSVKYGKVGVLLAEVVEDQQERIDQLESEVEEIKQMLQ